MFIRKLFNISDKIKWLSLELVVVFIGVYLAFLFQSYNENRRLSGEKEKVYTALKYELEYFRVDLPGRASYARSEVRKNRELLREGNYIDYSLWIYLEPQYAFQIIEYAINLEDTNIIDFQLYNQLVTLYSNIKRLSHAESMIMETSQRYVPVLADVSDNSREAKLREADNLQNFSRFIKFMNSRAGSLQSVAVESDNCLKIINQLMDPELRKSIEEDLIRSRINDFESLEDAQNAVRSLYPDFTEEEVKAIYESK